MSGTNNLTFTPVHNTPFKLPFVPVDFPEISFDPTIVQGHKVCVSGTEAKGRICPPRTPFCLPTS
jgi:hypothetical protein